LFGQWPGSQVPDELAGLLDVVQAVFAPDAAETDDRRDVVEGVEEAVGRQVKAAFAVVAGDPADGPWADDGVERSWGRPWPLAGS
jgi:hypothetical protein